MAYITKSNAKKLIVRSTDLSLADIIDDLYHYDFYFFNKREVSNLKGIRELFKDPEKFFLSYYQPLVIPKDSYRFLHPERQPSYHKDSTCLFLKSDYFNFEVPLEIRDRGEAEVIKFRNWYASEKINYKNPREFIYKLQLAFPYIGPIHPSSIERKNSGFEVKDNISLSELEEKIDAIYRSAVAFYRDNPDLQNIIKKYQKWTFLAYLNRDIEDNSSGLDDASLKLFLRSYDEDFKMPIKELLVEYYRVQFNPDMTFEGQLLDQLGFKSCVKCLSGSNWIDFEPGVVEYK